MRRNRSPLLFNLFDHSLPGALWEASTRMEAEALLTEFAVLDPNAELEIVTDCGGLPEKKTNAVPAQCLNPR